MKGIIILKDQELKKELSKYLKANNIDLVSRIEEDVKLLFIDEIDVFLNNNLLSERKIVYFTYEDEGELLKENKYATVVLNENIKIILLTWKMAKIKENIKSFILNGDKESYLHNDQKKRLRVSLAYVPLNPLRSYYYNELLVENYLKIAENNIKTLCGEEQIMERRDKKIFYLNLDPYYDHEYFLDNILFTHGNRESSEKIRVHRRKREGTLGECILCLRNSFPFAESMFYGTSKVKTFKNSYFKEDNGLIDEKFISLFLDFLRSNGYVHLIINLQKMSDFLLWCQYINNIYVVSNILDKREKLMEKEIMEHLVTGIAKEKILYVLEEQKELTYLKEMEKLKWETMLKKELLI